MPFSNQFALSLEVTRLLPLSTLYDKGTQAIINFGRQLKNSGSDIIVEDDLVLVFGRSNISATLGSSFKTLVAESGSNIPLLEGIMLQAGPGPTVGRALREPPYFSMVVQLSLLSWSYETRALATALSETLHKRITPEPSMASMTIDSVLRVRAKGYGNQIIFDSLKDLESCIKAEDKAVLEEIQVTVCAISQLISSHLYHDDERRFGIEDRRSSNFRDCTANLRHHVDRNKILKASKFLFENPDLSQRTVDNYIPSHTYHALKGCELPVPSAFRAVCNRRSISDDWIAESWDLLCLELVTLSVLNIAFAHVLNLEDCTSLMLSAHSSIQLSREDLSEQLHDWDGRRNLYVRAETWLQIVSAVLMGSTATTKSLPWDLVCLVSDGGWSVWMPIFSGEDPASLKSGSVFICPGTRCRNGVWKSFVWDMGTGEKLQLYGCQKVEGAGQQASLRCARKVSFANPFCGELTQSFVVFACITQHDNSRGKRSTRIGFRELQESLWCTSLLKKCRHGIQKDSVKLPINCATLAGFEEHVIDLDERKLICLTAGSISARWLALVSFYGAFEFDGTRKYALLLRDNNCCFQCAVDQLALEPRNSILIL